MSSSPSRKSIQKVDNRKVKPPRLSIRELMSLNESHDQIEVAPRRKSYFIPQISPSERATFQANNMEIMSASMRAPTRGATPKGMSLMRIDSIDTKRMHKGSETYSSMGTEIFDDNKDHIIRILSKPSERRNKDDILLLQRSFADIQFFNKTQQELDTNSYRMLFKNLKLETFQPGQRVFNHGTLLFYLFFKRSCN